jgi:hypothetical protein
MTDINPVFKNLPTEIKNNICLYTNNFIERLDHKHNKYVLVSLIDLKSDYWKNFEENYKKCLFNKIDELEKPILISPSRSECKISRNGDLVCQHILAHYEYPPRIIKYRKTKHEIEMEEELARFRANIDPNDFIGHNDHADY